MNFIMGFSKHLMGFPGYYGAWILNKYSLAYFETSLGVEAITSLPFYKEKTEAQKN